MIFDCHTHLSCPEITVDLAEHQEIYSELDGFFVLGGLHEDRRQTNEQLSQYVRQNSKAVGFAAVNPVEDPVGRKDIKGLTLDEGLRGVILYCPEERFHPTHSRAMRLYEQCQQMGLVVFFHNCPPYSSQAVMDFGQPWLLDEIARTFPDLKIILGRMGLPFLEQGICLLSKHPNVYADLTILPHKVWQVYSMVIGAYEAQIMDKLLFGSGYPYMRPDTCIETLLGFNKMFSDTHLPQVPREKLRSIVERNSLEVLGLK